ncbi:hypothetical protein BC832DRAFT_225006 [Gaertneriomyces semiglobifer]|nr:hypothetical protein BC832DRAFT_225006 [Gaertneriomyces semiglobifer]
MEVPGTPYVRCRPAICSRGCSPTAGVCIADEFCSCSLNPAFEGFDCSIPKGVNDSISLGFPTSLVPYTTASRELIYAKLSALYNPTYDVVYRSFDEDQGSALSRRSADPSQSMVVFRHSLKQAGSNDFLNSREMTSLAAKTSVLLSSAGLPPATSQVETGQLANIDLGGLGISVIAVTAIGIMVTVAMEAFLMRRTARPSWVKLLEALPSLAAVFTWAFPLTEITTPTAVSCKVQVLLAPFTLGIALPHLVAKACYYFYHMKNGVLLSKPMCIGHFRRILIGLVTMNAMYWIITITWVSHDPPVPTIVYRGSSQSRYWTCRSSMTPNERNPYLFVLLGYSVLLLGLSGLLARRIAVSEFAKNAAGQHKIVLLNVLNILGAGGLLVGLTVPQFLSARVQFIITVLCVYTIAGVLVMARAVYGMAVIHAKSDDDIGSLIRRLAFGTNQSEKTVEYTPTRSANQLIARWDAVEVEFHSPYLVMIDSDSKKGQFHELKACEASKDVDHCVKLSIKGNGSVFLQMKSEEEVASWIGNFEQHQSGGVKETDSLS